MAELSTDDLAQLDLLESEIVDLAKRDPKFRESYQQIRASFTIAEAVIDILERAKLTIYEVSNISGIPLEIIQSVVSAAPDAFATVDIVAAISDAAGFRFELQFIPDQPHEFLPRNGSEVTAQGIPGGVLIKFSSPIQNRSIHSTLTSGLKRLASKSGDHQFFTKLAPLSGRDIALWELVRLADNVGFKLQFRFAPLKETSLTKALDRIQELRAKAIPESVGGYSYSTTGVDPWRLVKVYKTVEG